MLPLLEPECPVVTDVFSLCNRRMCGGRWRSLEHRARSRESRPKRVSLMRDLRNVGLEGKRLCVIQIVFCAATGFLILDVLYL